MKNPIRVAINGFGRIGRCFFWQIEKRVQPYARVKIVGINDPGLTVENAAYLLRNDSVYGRLGRVYADGKRLLHSFSEVDFLQEKDPLNLPWKELEVDVVIDASGRFTTASELNQHISVGARRVILTAPSKDPAVPMVTPGVGEGLLTTSLITSNASCTTNCANPLVATLNDALGVIHGSLLTIHAYTNGQGLVDGPAGRKDFRGGRAAAVNIIPASTGAAVATAQMLGLEGKLSGLAMRVPVEAGSVLDFSFQSRVVTTKEEVNRILAVAAVKRFAGIMEIDYSEPVSRDIIGQPFGCIVDATLTEVVDSHLVSVRAWYDNELSTY